MDGKRLARLRSEAGLTQVQLSAKAQVGLQTISSIECGKDHRGAPVNPKLATLESLALALDTTVVELLADTTPAAAAGTTRTAP